MSHLPDFRGGILLTNWSTQLAGHWSGGGKFTSAYFELQRWVRRPGIEGDRRMFTPMDYHFGTTELGQLLRKGHYGLTLEAEAWEPLAAWAGLNAPFYGTWGEIPQFVLGYAAEVLPASSVVGGGTGTESTVPTQAVALTHPRVNADELAESLRRRPLPVVARISGGRVLLDLRTVEADEEEALLSALGDVATS